MPAQQYVARLHRRKLLPVVNMPVRRIDHPLARRNERVIRKDRKIQHQLVNLGIAVSAHAVNLLLLPVQHRDDLLRIVLLRQIISRPVIQDIPKQKQTIRLLSFVCLQQQPAVFGRSVDV